MFWSKNKIVTMDVTFFESQIFFSTSLQVENVCEDSFEIENNGTSSINFGLPLLDLGTLILKMGLLNPMPTYRLETGINHDTRTREEKLFTLVYSKNKKTQPYKAKFLIRVRSKCNRFV